MYHRIEHPQLRIAFLKALHKFSQSLCCKLRFRSAAAGVLVVADLENHLVERLLLLAVTDMLIVVFDASVFTSLPRVVFRKSFVEKLVIDLFNIVLHQNYILIGAGSIDILSDEFSVIVTNAPFPDASADSLLDVITLLSNASAIRREKTSLWFVGVSTHAFVTFAKVTQRCFRQLLNEANESLCGSVPLHPFLRAYARGIKQGIRPEKIDSALLLHSVKGDSDEVYRGEQIFVYLISILNSF